MQGILLHSACELQFALRDIQKRKEPQYFDPTVWKIATTLNPIVDADIQPGLGATRKTHGVARFMTWLVGTGNGVTAEMRGERTGSIDFTFDFKKLMDDTHLPCDRDLFLSRSYKGTRDCELATSFCRRSLYFRFRVGQSKVQRRSNNEI